MTAEFDKMDPELKTKLVAALRSGKYIKWEGDLKFVEATICRHCTMGVLADLKYPNKWIERYERQNGMTMEVPGLTLEGLGLTATQRNMIVKLNDWAQYGRRHLEQVGIPEEFLNKIDPDGTLEQTTFDHMADFIENYF
ncbi:hypothetical protein GCM10028806_33670 [Spirosoma terrae]|uniref:Uncharacterized protein n=1 Tax=Spirosoma terrae TaxID=1968276 RepID=A0A6L9LGA7_9BACT|nr:hypothetical protein [Spirosoma terrae]NDU95679.1 hypothetical protein [Spirosoma terrae]